MPHRIAWMIAAIAISIQSAHAQIIFKPVQYQYGSDFHYYYGGSDPAVLARGDRLLAMFEAAKSYGAGDVRGHRGDWVVGSQLYSDAFPSRDPALFAFTAEDAANEAAENCPRFFTMRRELAHARRRCRAAQLTRATSPPAGGRWTGAFSRTPRGLSMMATQSHGRSRRTQAVDRVPRPFWMVTAAGPINRANWRLCWSISEGCRRVHSGADMIWTGGMALSTVGGR
jgi:hypothetical protein